MILPRRGRPRKGSSTHESEPAVRRRSGRARTSGREPAAGGRGDPGPLNAATGLSHDDYARLLAFRDGLRRFTRWSETQAREVGLTPAQHQLLVAVKGHDPTRGPTVGELAAHLGVRQHSAVELTNRAEAGGYVSREPDPEDGRRVRLALTELGEDRLVQLTQLHLAEFRQLAQLLDRLTTGLDG